MTLCEDLRKRLPGLGAHEYALSVTSGNGFFDATARETLFDGLARALGNLPPGSEVLESAIVLYQQARSIGFYFVARR